MANVYIGEQKADKDTLDVRVHDVTHFYVGKVIEHGTHFSREIYVVNSKGQKITLDIFSDNKSDVEVKRLAKGHRFGSVQHISNKK